MIQESEPLPTTHFFVGRGMVGAEGLVLPWQGKLFDEVFTRVKVNWKPGFTDIEIGNRFFAERWQISELASDLVALKQAAVGIRGIVLGPEIEDYEWWQAGNKDLNARGLFFKGGRSNWIISPDPEYFPQRLVADIDKEKTEKWLPKGVSLDQTIEAFRRIREIIESAHPVKG